MEIQPTEFEYDFDIEVEDELRWDDLDADPLVATSRDIGADPDITGSGGTSTSGIRQPGCVTRASTRVVDVHEGGFSEESEPDVDVEHCMSSSGAEFDD